MNTPTTSKVYVENISDYDLDFVLQFIKNTLSLEPFCTKLSHVQKILIKPNMLGAHHPDKAVTTHPVILEAMIIYLQALNKEIIVGDSPGGIVSAQKVWKETGLLDVCEKYQVKLIDFGKEGIFSKNIDSIEYHFEKQIFEVDAIINIGKMKTHSLMLFTGTVKNLYGLIPGLYKSELHKKFPQPRDFSKVLTNIYANVHDKIIFSVLDGIIGMEGEGPSSGKPRHFNRLYIGEHAPAIDYFASRYMGFKINQLDYIDTALKIDNLTVDSLVIDDSFKNDILTDVDIKEVLFRKKFLDSLPGFIKKVFSYLFSYYPYFENSCKKCSVCVKSCPVGALKLDTKDKKPILDKQKCIKCMCCHELCPYHAVIIKKSFLATLFLKNM